MRKGTDGSARISFDAIDWNALYRAGGQEILEWQALVVARFETRAPGAIRCRCEGVAAYRVDGALAAGDIYGRYIPSLASTHELDAGVHEIRMRLRAKHVGSVRCSVWRSSKAYARSSAVPDWVVGDASPFGGLLSVEVWRPAGMRRVTLASDGTFAIRTLDDDNLDTAGDGNGLARVCRSAAIENASLASNIRSDHRRSGWRADRHRGRVDRVAGAHAERADGVPRRRRFGADRRGREAAGVLRPNSLPRPGRSSRHGVSARSSAYAINSSRADRATTLTTRLAFPELAPICWHLRGTVLANWEGVGLRHALKALDALTAWRARGRRRSSSPGIPWAATAPVCSRSGSGSRAKGEAINAGWPRKEVYGDSNTRYLHDQGAHLIEPALRGVLDATLAGWRAWTLDVASNLCCMRSLLRLGRSTRRCHRITWAASRVFWRDVRRSTRRSRPRGHFWWWDTAVANDGGTVNDERLRKFFAEAFSSQDECPIGYEHVTTNADAVLGSCGFRVEQQVALPDFASRPRRREKLEDAERPAFLPSTLVNLIRLTATHPLTRLGFACPDAGVGPVRG